MIFASPNPPQQPIFEHQISDIREYVVCPYLWYTKRVLMIDFDNVYTVSGKIAHKRQDNRRYRKLNDAEYEVYDLFVGNESNLRGVCDAVLFRKSDNGIPIPAFGTNDLYTVHPIEYKQRGHDGTILRADQLQCVAQAVCLEKMLSTHIDSFFLYSQRENKRREYMLTTDMRADLNAVIKDMDRLLQEGTVPERRVTKTCSACSATNYCLPKRTRDKNLGMLSYVKTMTDEEGK